MPEKGMCGNAKHMQDVCVALKGADSDGIEALANEESASAAGAFHAVVCAVTATQLPKCRNNDDTILL
jgi:hypothetical protein